MADLPLHGITATKLPDPPLDAADALRRARASEDPKRALRDALAATPTLLAGWADLADLALREGDPVAAYAFARVGYHRGLDALRAAGWRGQGEVPWSHEPNRGFLRSLDALRRAATAIGEEGEPERCADFLRQLDAAAADELGVEAS